MADDLQELETFWTWYERDENPHFVAIMDRRSSLPNLASRALSEAERLVIEHRSEYRFRYPHLWNEEVDLLRDVSFELCQTYKRLQRKLLDYDYERRQGSRPGGEGRKGADGEAATETASHQGP